MHKTTQFVLILFALLGILSILIFAGQYYTAHSEYDNLRDSTYSIYALPIPDSVRFVGEAVPLENFDVRESLDKELHKISYWHSETILQIKRAKRYFPLIEKILKQHNIPEDFKYLAVNESGLSNVVSPAGAAGFWQIMKKTGKSYGLEINNEIDERYHLEKATEVACKFLQDAYRKYNNWALVAASYNYGQGNLDKQLKKQQANSYYDLLLNEETARYVYRIIAFKLIMENPQNYGFKFRKKDLYQPVPFNEILIDTSISNFADFAKDHNTNYKILKFFNPWLRDSFLSNKNKKEYIIKIPLEGSRSKNYAKDMQNPESIVNSIHF